MKKITLIALLLSCSLIAKAQEEEKKKKSGEWRQGLGIENVIGSWSHHCWNLNFAATKEKHQLNAGLKIPVSILHNHNYNPLLSFDFSYRYVPINKFWVSPYIVGGLEYIYRSHRGDISYTNSNVTAPIESSYSAHRNLISPYLGLGACVKLFDRIQLTADCSYGVGVSMISTKISVTETNELLTHDKYFRAHTGRLFDPNHYNSLFRSVRWSLGATYFFGGKKSDKKSKSK